MLLTTLTLVTASAHAAFGACKPGVFLTVGGNIKKFTNEKDKTFEYSEADYLALPPSSITTSTAFTAKSKFEGPRLSDVMKDVGASGKSLRLVAVDNYARDIDLKELEKYGVILAHTRNGTRLTRRDQGPLWSIYPRDNHPQILNTPIAASKYVWQVCRIDVQ